MFYIQYLDEIHAYKVNQVKVVEPSDSSDLKIVPGKDYITLLTCYPYGINSHRLLVRGERVAFNGEITFDNNGNIKSITQKAADDVMTESADAPISAKERMSLFDEIKNGTSKVDVYGMKISLRLIIIIITAIVILIVTSIIIVLTKHFKKKLTKKENE